MVTVHEDQYTFMITFRSIIVGLRNVSDKICREYQNTHVMLCYVILCYVMLCYIMLCYVMFSNSFIRKSCRL